MAKKTTKSKPSAEAPKSDPALPPKPRPAPAPLKMPPEPKPPAPVEVVTLECIQRSAYQIELVHEIWCERLGKCECEMRGRITSIHDRKTGKVGKVQTKIRCPREVRIAPGAANAVTLAKVVLDCPGVARALRSDAKVRPRLRLR